MYVAVFFNMVHIHRLKNKIALLPSSWPVPLLFLGRGGTRGAAGGQDGVQNVNTQLRTVWPERKREKGDFYRREAE